MQDTLLETRVLETRVCKIVIEDQGMQGYV